MLAVSSVHHTAASSDLDGLEHSVPDGRESRWAVDTGRVVGSLEVARDIVVAVLDERYIVAGLDIAVEADSSVEFHSDVELDNEPVKVSESRIVI